MIARVVILLAGLLAPLPAAAQPATNPRPAPDPRPTTPVKPEDIKGAVTNPRLSVASGTTIAAGDFLDILFEYTTETPGATSAMAEVFVGGKWHPAFGHQPGVLDDKAGKGQVRVSYLTFGGRSPNITADEIKLYLYSSTGAPGRRLVATIKGPVTFEGVELFTTTLKQRIDALEKETAELRKTVARLEKALAEKGK